MELLKAVVLEGTVEQTSRLLEVGKSPRLRVRAEEAPKLAGLEDLARRAVQGNRLNAVAGGRAGANSLGLGQGMGGSRPSNSRGNSRSASVSASASAVASASVSASVSAVVTSAVEGGSADVDNSGAKAAQRRRQQGTASGAEGAVAGREEKGKQTAAAAKKGGREYSMLLYVNAYNFIFYFFIIGPRKKKLESDRNE